MALDPKFSRDAIVVLSDDERTIRLRELSVVMNSHLSHFDTLESYQAALYSLIDELTQAGHSIGRWEYDCEIEIWGGDSYMDASLPDELLIRSEFPNGVRLAWDDFDALSLKA